MQLGSGTWDFQPGLTYLGESDLWSWGAQVLGTVRAGMNDRDYRLGDRYRLSAWTQYKVTDWFGPSARLDWHGWGNVHGADPAMNPARNPAFDATKQWGERLDFLLGLNFYISKGLLKGNRLSYLRAASSIVTNTPPPSATALSRFSIAIMRWPRLMT